MATEQQLKQQTESKEENSEKIDSKEENSEKMDSKENSEKTDSKEENSEKTDSKEENSEKMDSKEENSEKMDSKEENSEKMDSKEENSEKTDSKEENSEKTDSKEENSVKIDSKEENSVKIDSKEENSEKIDSKEENSEKIDSKEENSVKTDSKEENSEKTDSKEENSEKTDSKEENSEKTDSKQENSEKTDSKQEKSVKSETKSTPVTEELKNKIVRQIEYYFGNYNLPRDKFLTEQTKSDDGWISLETMVKFKRLADLATDHEVIRKALKKSEIMEVDDKKNRIRRSPNHPLPYFGEDLKAETIKRTIYCKGLPKDGSVTLDILLEYFQPYAPFDTIHMRQYFDKQTKKQGFKGSILIVFPNEEKAKGFMDIDDVKYNGMPLLRKWHKDYLEEKAEEIKERKARKEARLEQLQKEGNSTNTPELNEIEPIPRGSFIFASGFTNTTTREDIKAAMMDYTDDVAFIDFSKGDTEGYIRFATPYSNKDFIQHIEKELKVNDADISFRLVEGEEEDEQVRKAEIARTKTLSQFSRKRKAGGRGRGGYSKRRKY